MRSHKPFTSATFTKRVDHEAGRHRPARAMSEPGRCESCGALYVNRRWTHAPTALEDTQVQHQTAEHLTICPACKQKSVGEPRGFVFLEGSFLAAHRQEIEQLLRNEAMRAGEDNPLARILEFDKSAGRKVIVSTTTEHLAQRLGHALEKAFGGNVDYDFSHENKLARVSWKRD